jgi:hypothetical protein
MENTFMPTAQEGPFFCVWEAKEGVTISNLQDYVDAPDDIKQSLALNNAIQRIDLELTGGTTPYRRKFDYLKYKSNRKGIKMATLNKKSFDNPDEVKTPEKTNAATVNFGTVAATKLVAQPGWKWSEGIEPHVGGHRCQPAMLVWF